MPFDAIFISNLSKELNTACGSRIDKISQPQRDEIVISLRAAGFNKKLLISVRSGSSRISFTEQNFENCTLAASRFTRNSGYFTLFNAKIKII